MPVTPVTNQQRKYIFYILTYFNFNNFIIYFCYGCLAEMSSQLPYPMQPQGMPLPYTLPRTGPYPTYISAPPMPTAYNPYATLHHYQPQGELLYIY